MALSDPHHEPDFISIVAASDLHHGSRISSGMVSRDPHPSTRLDLASDTVLNTNTVSDARSDTRSGAKPDTT